jgi:aspartate aminotransferase-like enzyme
MSTTSDRRSDPRAARHDAPRHVNSRDGETQLRIPGPTPCPPAVLAAMSRQMVNHRGPEFADLLLRLTGRLKPWFGTDGDVLLFPGSGTGALEAAVVNTLSPGQPVLAVSVGAFGEHLGTIAERFGADVRWLRFAWGQAADPAAVAAALDADPAISAVLVTHNETSTGVANPLAQLAEVVKGRGKTLVVDGVSSVSSMPVLMDAWGCDVVVSASQKGWMVPPGVAMVAVRRDAWPIVEAAAMPRYYWDLRWAKRMLGRGQPPYTPAISIFYGLDAALDLLEAEGQAAVYARHIRVGARVRAGVKAMGLRLFGDERFASDTVTACTPPPEVDSDEIRRQLLEAHGVVLAGGQGKLEGQIVRIGHLGMVGEDDVNQVLEALASTLPVLLNRF